MRKDHPETPDGRYFVAKGRLWRKTDPGLSDIDRRAAGKRLMQARRDVSRAQTEDETRDARTRIDAAKHDLGERGPVWWDDDASDESRRAPWNSSYADWWAALPEQTRKAAETA